MGIPLIRGRMMIIQIAILLLVALIAAGLENALHLHISISRQMSIWSHPTTDKITYIQNIIVNNHSMEYG